MERDALIAHGTSFLLQDRLMNCSDYSTAWVCRNCGSLISLGYEDVTIGGLTSDSGDSSNVLACGPSGEYCRVCRAVEQEENERARASLGNGAEMTDMQPVADLRVRLPAVNVVGRSGKGGDMDVIAIPYVFRYLCSELASMGIAVSVEVV
jgi:DNA-directed RNA polymerase I subunit RPA2